MTIVAVLSGIAVVLAAILWLKLPAFLALLAGAVVTGVLTSPYTRAADALAAVGARVSEVRSRGDRQLVFLDRGVVAGPAYEFLYLTPSGDVIRSGVTKADGAEGPEWRTELFIADDQNPNGQEQPLFGPLVRRGQSGTTSQYSYAERWFVPATAAVELSRVLDQNLGQRLAAGFGKTAGSIGLIVALAAVIGQCLLHSGAADTIVRRALRFTGETGAPAAFVASGFVLGIPVFFDTVFYLMIPLGKALYERTGTRYLTYVLTIVCGGTMAHSLVPPTPGPLLVASELGVPIATMIVVGCGVGLVTVLVGYAFAMVVGGRVDLRPPEATDQRIPAGDPPATPVASPGLIVSLTPIVLPVALITLASLLDAGAITLPASLSAAYGPIATLGDRNVALLISAGYALILLRLFNRGGRPLSDVVTEALTSGAMIVLITGAGGAFGLMLREAGLRSLISDLPSAAAPVLLTLAFLVTAGIRTAQGSATVAMITAVALFADLGRPEVLGCDPVYLAVAIGCGSKPLAWMNDSGFWVITRMSGLTPSQGLRYVTPMTALMGVTGLVTTLVLAAVWPGV